ncbi:hypothetical protein [Nonomuraea basaltis]|uniref:hypothetical protein n=1 Tax=Nonomuraea basaltis TaxID=2495887 RepID=UPI00110C55C0|nr:hypothetical protein [Nonomuraea basaltis]TMR92728.1 hypothetical protein EJK15_43070 [Nonomuraea basaltis]
MSRFRRMGGRFIAALVGVFAAALISAAVAAPAHALPPWYVGDDIGMDVDTNRVYYEDGRPYVISYCWSYEWGLMPCGRYL